MKKILFLMMAAITIVGCSKSNEDGTGIPSNPESPKEYIVSLGFNGEITDITESPLTRAATNDLYGIQVYSMSSYETGYNPYAYGLFDDKAKMTIKLLEGYKYKFVSTMIVDGKNRINSSSNGYSFPFYSDGSMPCNNTFIYSSGRIIGYINNGCSDITINGVSKTFYRPNLDRYFGDISEYSPSANGSVSINMKRVSFGAKIIANGITEGKVKITLSNAPDMYISYPNMETQDIFTFYGGGSEWAKDDYAEIVTVSASWEKADGTIVPLVTQDMTFKRNKLTTITIKVNDNSVNNGVDISQENTPMGDGGNITIEAGNNTGTDVNPSI